MKTVLCFGDSNTHGTPPVTALGQIARYPRDVRWPGVMAANLPDWQVIEEGLPGRTTVHDDPIEGAHRNGLTVLPALLESHRPLDVVLIMLGTNDLKFRFSLGAFDIAAGVERLALTIRASTAGPGGSAPAVMLVAPPPIEETGVLDQMFAGGAAKSRALGPAIAAVAARMGLPFVDAGALIAVSPVDGIHYEPAAHHSLGLAIANAMQTHFQ